MPRPLFDSQRHKYTTPDGLPLVGVTSVLSEYTRAVIGGKVWFVDVSGNVIDGETLNRAADFGSAVHKALEFTLTLGPDGFTYPEEIGPVIRQIDQWRKDFRPEIIAVEAQLYHPRLLYAGTMDIVCRIGGRLAIVDAKTGAGKLTGPQVAAYSELWREETGERAPIDRYMLHLPRDGSNYKLIPLKNPRDWQFFQVSLFRKNFLAEL